MHFRLITSTTNTTKRSTALIPYTHPKTSMEFIDSEVNRLKHGILNGTIAFPFVQFVAQAKLPCPLVSLLPSERTRLNLSLLEDLIIEQSDMGKLAESVERLSSSVIDSFDVQLPFSIPILGWHFEFEDSANISPLSDPKVNGDEIAEVFQSQAGFTIASDKKPILATFGCGPCVALGGWDPTNKIAFLVHFSNAGEVREAGGQIFYNISKFAKEAINMPIQLHLRGGIDGQSETTIQAIKLWMGQRKDLPMVIASEDILCSGMNGGKSLSIDSRTGEVSEYDPMSNPKRGEFSEIDAIMAVMSAFNPIIHVVYTPK